MDKKQIETWEQCLMVWHLFLKKKKKKLQLLLHAERMEGARG